jgi:hypothetical protein
LVLNGIAYNLMTIWNWEGQIQIQFGSMTQPPFDTLEGRRAFAEHLGAVPGSRTFSDDELLHRWPALYLSRLVDAGGMNQFFAAWDWHLEEIKSY